MCLNLVVSKLLVYTCIKKNIFCTPDTDIRDFNLGYFAHVILPRLWSSSARGDTLIYRISKLGPFLGFKILRFNILGFFSEK